VTALVPFLILGLMILILGGRLLIQSSAETIDGPTVTIEDFSAARTNLDRFLAEAATLQRIFAAEDMEFIRRNGSAPVQSLFREERKALAILWLRKMQKQMAHFMDLHWRLASCTNRPSPRFEIKLATKYLIFRVASHFVLFVLWVRGPFEAARIIDCAARVTGSFGDSFRSRMDDINLLRLDPASDPPVV
jgi:hypothetical protein